MSKACDYIQELRQSNARLEEELNTVDRLRLDNQLLKQEVFHVPAKASHSKLKSILNILVNFIVLILQVYFLLSSVL